MHHAKVLFEQNGIGNVTIEQISESADLSRSTFFSHFASLDDLMTQIANEEINDMFNSVCDAESPSITLLMEQLNTDSHNYPYLTGELLMRGILSGTNSSFAQVDGFIREKIEQSGGYAKAKEIFTSKEISALTMGAYFGLFFQKFFNGESFDSPEQTNSTIKKFISYIEKQ